MPGPEHGICPHQPRKLSRSCPRPKPKPGDPQKGSLGNFDALTPFISFSCQATAVCHRTAQRTTRLIRFLPFFFAADCVTSVLHLFALLAFAHPSPSFGLHPGLSNPLLRPPSNLTALHRTGDSAFLNPHTSHPLLHALSARLLSLLFRAAIPTCAYPSRNQA